MKVDAVIERAEGEWMAAEIKLGGEKLIEQGVNSLLRNSLLRLRSRVNAHRTGQPSTPIVITATVYGFEHWNGVQVVPIATLGP